MVERTFAWLSRFRRLAICCERRLDIHMAFTVLGCALACLNQIGRLCQALSARSASSTSGDKLEWRCADVIA